MSNLNNYVFIDGNAATFSGNVTASTVIATTLKGDGGNISNVTAANITGAVAFATTANSVAGANVTGTVASATVAASANSVAGANVTGAVAFATTANSVAGANVTGTVASATVAASANSVAGANVTGAVAFATTANSVAGANVSGEVAFAATSNSVSGANVTGTVASATVAASANSVAGANVSGQVSFAAVANSVAGANVTDAVAFATTANSVAGANVTGAVAFATTANSVAGANVTGQVANALISGTVYTNAQPNITSVGTLTSLAVTGNITAGNVIGGNLVTANFVAGTLTTIAQPNITSVGTLVDLTVSGNATVQGNTITDTIISNTGSLSLLSTGTNQNITLTPTGSGVVDVSGARITDLAEPVASTDAATKGYVDATAEGLSIQESCLAATNADLATITGDLVTYNNGTAGVGATLTLDTALTTLDGVTLVDGDRILVKNESTPAYNGIYTWGTGGLVLTRATNFDTTTDIIPGDFVFVSSGTQYENTGWVQTNTITTIGTSPIEFTQFSGAGAYTAGTGLTLTGTQFSITNTAVTAGTYGNATHVVTQTVNGQGQITNISQQAVIANAETLAGTQLKNTVLSSNLTSVGTLTGLSVNGNITATGNITGAYIKGNGSQLTGMYGNTQVAAYLPVNTSNVSGNNFTVSGNITAGSLGGQEQLLGYIATATTVTFDLMGNLPQAFTAGQTIYISGILTGPTNLNGYWLVTAATISTVTIACTLQPTDPIVDIAYAQIANVRNISATGNITGAYFIGDGGFLSNIAAANIVGAYGNSNVSVYLASGTDTAGYVTVGNISTTSIVSTPMVEGDTTNGLILSAGADYTANLQYAQIRQGTDANDIFLSTGDDAVDNLYLGHDLHHVVIANTGAVIVATTSGAGDNYSWEFKNTGALVVPGGMEIYNQGILQAFDQDLIITVREDSVPGLSLINQIEAGGGETANTTLTSNQFSINMDTAGTVQTWVFDTTGNLTLPGNTFAMNYANGDPVTFTGYSNSDVATYLASGTLATDIITTANVTASNFTTAGTAGTGNIVGVNYITANYLIGDGSMITNLPTNAPVVESVTSGSTLTPAALDTQFNVTALAVSATFAAPGGTPLDGQKLTIRILDNGTPQTLAWNAIYEVIGTTLPTTTVASKYTYVGCIYNAQSSKWDVVSVAQQA